MSHNIAHNAIFQGFTKIATTVMSPHKTSCGVKVAGDVHSLKKRSAVSCKAARAQSDHRPHNRPTGGVCQCDLFRAAGLMIRFGAGVCQMRAIFGRETCCNREPVVGAPSCEIFQRLPGIRAWSPGLLPLAWVFIYKLRRRNCWWNLTTHTPSGEGAESWLVFFLADAALRPCFQASRLGLLVDETSQKNGACHLNIYSDSMCFVWYMKWQLWRGLARSSAPHVKTGGDEISRLRSLICLRWCLLYCPRLFLASWLTLHVSAVKLCYFCFHLFVTHTPPPLPAVLSGQHEAVYWPWQGCRHVIWEKRRR